MGQDDVAGIGYGKWTGYLEEESWKPVQAALDASGGRLEVVHSTGHLLEEDITRFVRAVGAKKIVPIHTFEPSRVEAIVSSRRVDPIKLPSG